MDTAWMIRNDGRPFPVEHHIYADPEDGEDIMCAGEWLYQHTTCMWVRMLVLSMLVLWTKKETGGVFSYHRMLKYAGENVGFFPTADFIESIRNPITEMSYRMSWGLGDEEEKMLEQYYRTTLAQLNQEFLRARYGGMYDTESGCRDIIFRISSVGFDWYPIIQCFVKNCKLPIETVTIVRDAESTGMHNARYRSSDGETYYDRMSVELFLAERKNGLPKQHLYIMQGGVKQQDRHIYAALYEGKSFEEILRMGSEKSIRTKIKKLGEEENRLVAGYLTINQK